MQEHFQLELHAIQLSAICLFDLLISGSTFEFIVNSLRLIEVTTLKRNMLIIQIFAH